MTRPLPADVQQMLEDRALDPGRAVFIIDRCFPDGRTDNPTPICQACGALVDRDYLWTHAIFHLIAVTAFNRANGTVS
jgi:hypothetical protein